MRFHTPRRGLFASLEVPPLLAKNPLGTHTILSEWCLFKDPISPDWGLSSHASALPNDCKPIGLKLPTPCQRLTSNCSIESARTHRSVTMTIDLSRHFR